jgi:hypothetical protein
VELLETKIYQKLLSGDLNFNKLMGEAAMICFKNDRCIHFKITGYSVEAPYNDVVSFKLKGHDSEGLNRIIESDEIEDIIIQ